MHFAKAVVVLAVVLTVFAVPNARAGGVHQLDIIWEGPIPPLPVHIELKVYENQAPAPDKLTGVGSLDFDGVDATNVSCPLTACIEAVQIVGGVLRLNLSAVGHDKQKFKSGAYFEVCVGNEPPTGFGIPTSCDTAVPLNTPIAGSASGTFTIVGGAGTCIPRQLPCPVGPKVFSLNGEFRIPLDGCMPTALTFNVYRNDNDLKGTATADWNGAGLDNIACDVVACMTDAFMDGGDLVVLFESDGFEDDGTFLSNTSFELDLGACGSFMLANLHTSCSQAIFLLVPNPGGTPIGDGSLTLTDGCAACTVISPVGTEIKTWGVIKSIYEE